jgi:hypothetical protein
MREFENAVKDVAADRTEERHRATIKALAEESFKDHEITVESETMFRCAKPGTGIYAFRVCLLPQGVILVYGDIGETMFQRGGMEWLKSAVRHERVSDYVLSKIRPVVDWRTKEFMPGDALKELREIHDGVPHIDSKGVNFVEQAQAEGEDVCEDDWDRVPDPELACKIADEWLLYDVTGGHGEAWDRACHEHIPDYWEGPYCRDYNSTHLWCYWALSWFVRNLKEVTT